MPLQVQESEHILMHHHLQAFTPVAILLISWTFRIQDPSKRLAVIVVMISSGVALASRGELRFNLAGFLTQAAAVAVSSLAFWNSVLPLLIVHGQYICSLKRHVSS